MIYYGMLTVDDSFSAIFPGQVVRSGSTALMLKSMIGLGVLSNLQQSTVWV